MARSWGPVAGLSSLAKQLGWASCPAGAHTALLVLSSWAGLGGVPAGG